MFPFFSLLAAWFFGFAAIACGALMGIASHLGKYRLMLLYLFLAIVLVNIAIIFAVNIGTNASATL